MDVFLLTTIRGDITDVPCNVLGIRRPTSLMMMMTHDCVYTVLRAAHLKFAAGSI